MMNEETPSESKTDRGKPEIEEVDSKLSASSSSRAHYWSALAKLIFFTFLTLFLISTPLYFTSMLREPLKKHPFKHSLRLTENEAVQQELKEQRNIDKAIDALLVGQAFHNVPNKMRVGDTYRIEAGIAAKQITLNKIREGLQGKGEVQVTQNVSYDPSGVTMSLRANPDDFKIQSLSDETQIISSKEPAKWVWDVKPLVPGRYNLFLLAHVNLKIPESKNPVSHSFTVFDRDIPVQVNFSYSIGQFTNNHLKEVIPLIFGSGSVAGIVGWFLAKKHEKLNKTSKDAESS